MVALGLVRMHVNGERRTASATTLVEALRGWGYVAAEIAVAINGDFVPRGEYATRELKEDDDIEILAPAQGG